MAIPDNMVKFIVSGNTTKGIQAISWHDGALDDPTGLVAEFLKQSRYEDTHAPPPQVCATPTGPCWDASIDNTDPYVALLTVCSVFDPGYGLTIDAFQIPEFPVPMGATA